MQPMLNIALRAARSAGELIVRSTDRLDAISVNEKEAKDYVTEIDKAAEQSIVNALRKAYPNHGILGEEGGLLEGSGTAPITCGSSTRWMEPPILSAAFLTTPSASPASTAGAWNTRSCWTRYARKNSPLAAAVAPP